MSEPPTPEQVADWWKQAFTAGPTDVDTRFAALASAWGYEQGARAMQERCAKVCDGYECREDNAASDCAAAISALDPAPEEPRQEARGKVWPFAELPGELAERIEGYLRYNGGYVLGALRHAFIEEPATILTPEAAAARRQAQLAAAAPVDVEHKGG